MSHDHLSTTCAALGDVTRRVILARLLSGETSNTQSGRRFQMSLPAVSKHLKVLEGGSFEACGPDAQRRPCWLVTDPLNDAAEWLEEYLPFWEESLDRLEDYLRELQGKERNDGHSK